MLLIMFFIIILNIVAIALTYYCLSDIDKKDKLVFIAISVAVIYILTSFVYWISTKDVSIKEVSEMGKNLITFLFVPINGLVILPILAKSYEKYKMGMLKIEHFKNRALILGVILAILLIIECKYFKDIQDRVVVMIEQNQEELRKKQQNIYDSENELADHEVNEMSNTILNEISNNSTMNDIASNRLETNQIANETVNQTNNNEIVE